MNNPPLNITFKSIRWGELHLVPAKSNLWKDTCDKCLLKDTEECYEAPCYSDTYVGYYSLQK